MFRDIQIKELPLSLTSSRRQVEQFLATNGLRPESLDFYAGVFEGDEMLAGGGFSGNVIKCVAVSSQARERNLANTLVSYLRATAYAQQYGNLFAFTRPENEEIFTSLSFFPVGKSKGAILLETDPNGIRNYCLSLASYRRQGISGAIVMNCNPFTLGHDYLIRQAAAQVDNLHVILLEEERSEFLFSQRRQMVEKATEGYENVWLHDSGKYAISSATFPRYFLKAADDVSAVQAALDLDIFSRHIAPALGVTVRFVGHEPGDALTRQYNETMKQELPSAGIRVVEIERLNRQGEYISASRVRQLLHAFRLKEAAGWVPQTTLPFLLEHCAQRLADKACAALQEELQTTPKPGLVDREDNGAHQDMDFALMRKSIDTLYPYFRELAEYGLKHPEQEEVEGIRSIGVAAESAMLAATGGVNTHRGAIFSLGLCVVAAASLVAEGMMLTAVNLSDRIASLARKFPPQDKSNGADACKEHGLKGALVQACEGYEAIFRQALPYLRKQLAEGEERNRASIRTLLYIMSFLDDTNVCHRGGIDAVRRVKEEACRLASNYSITRVREMNRDYIKQNISPGGSADMLALTLLLHEITQ